MLLGVFGRESLNVSQLGRGQLSFVFVCSIISVVNGL